MFAARGQNRSSSAVVAMQSLEQRTMMIVADDGLGGDLGGLLGGLGDTIPPFPTTEAPLYLGRYNGPRNRQIKDTINTSDDTVDLVRIKVDKRLKFSIDLQALSQDADLVLYDGSGNVMASSGQFGTGDEHIGKNLGRGSYYIAVYGYGGQTNYTLHVNSKAAAPKK